MIKIIDFYYQGNSKFLDTIGHYTGVIVYRAILENLHYTLIIIYQDNQLSFIEIILPCIIEMQVFHYRTALLCTYLFLGYIYLYPSSHGIHQICIPLVDFLTQNVAYIAIKQQLQLQCVYLIQLHSQLYVRICI